MNINTLTSLADYNFFDVFIGFVGIVVAWKFLYTTFVEGIIQKFGWETAKMRQKREDHELLQKTSQNLSLLQEKHEKDERGLESALEHFIEEVRESFERVDKKIEGFYENQTKYRKQSLDVQKELTNSIKDLADTQKSNSEQISALMCGSKELLGNTIDERYARYIDLGGIPQSEVDDFDDIYIAYRGLNGNHGRQTKYEYVKNHLPVIPTKTEIIMK